MNPGGGIWILLRSEEVPQQNLRFAYLPLRIVEAYAWITPRSRNSFTIS